MGQKIGVTFWRDTQTDKHRSLLYRLEHGLELYKCLKLAACTAFKASIARPSLLDFAADRSNKNS